MNEAKRTSAVDISDMALEMCDLSGSTAYFCSVLRRSDGYSCRIYAMRYHGKLNDVFEREFSHAIDLYQFLAGFFDRDTVTELARLLDSTEIGNSVYLLPN